ncbi:MAG TPA: ROK family protein, partial [Candidatus Krumholzibacteriaceae bacterium]|nr:ROK family protein [Candidatus Krumholzibacteriaceae bacterium]
MGMVYGIDIGGTNIKLGIVDKDGVIQKEGQIRTRAEEGPSAVISRVLEWFNSNRGGRSDSDIIGAGIGCAGLLDRERGFLYSSPNLPRWDNLELGKLFSERIGVPVVVDNDVNCAAYGEFLFGAGRGANNFICITLGTGVGGGIVINGRLYRGETGQAGEIGHMIIKFDGRLCRCQNRGCLEAYIGSAAIVERTKEMLKQESSNPLLDIERLTVKDITEAAREGNKLAVKSLEKTGIYFGIGLSNIVHIINPEVIAVGGGVSAA